MCNTLFTYTRKNILLTFGVIFSVFPGPNEHLQVSECPIAVWSVTSQDHLSSQHYGGCVLLMQIGHRTETGFNQRTCGKRSKIQLCLLCCEDVGEKGTFDSILNFKYFIPAMKFRWPTQIYGDTLLFLHSPVAA